MLVFIYSLINVRSGNLKGNYYVHTREGKYTGDHLGRITTGQEWWHLDTLVALWWYEMQGKQNPRAGCWVRGAVQRSSYCLGKGSHRLSPQENINLLLPVVCSHERGHLCKRIGSRQKSNIWCRLNHADLAVRHRFVVFLKTKQNISGQFSFKVQIKINYNLNVQLLHCQSFRNTNCWCSVTLIACFPSKVCGSLNNNKDNLFLLHLRHHAKPSYYSLFY